MSVWTAAMAAFQSPRSGEYCSNTMAHEIGHVMEKIVSIPEKWGILFEQA